MNEGELRQLFRKKYLELDFISHGIALRSGDLVLINRDLLKTDNVLKKVVDHELGHTKKTSIKDFCMDFIGTINLGILFFIFAHPKALTQFIPIWFHKNEILVNVTLLVSYLLFVVLAVIIFI